MLGYVVTACIAFGGGFALHALMAPLARWDVGRELARSLPALARRFETDVAFQRACFNYSAASAEHRCELTAMAAALDAYEHAKAAAVPAWVHPPERRYVDGLGEAERHARESGGHRGQDR